MPLLDKLRRKKSDAELQNGAGIETVIRTPTVEDDDGEVEERFVDVGVQYDEEEEGEDMDNEVYLHNERVETTPAHTAPVQPVQQPVEEEYGDYIEERDYLQKKPSIVSYVDDGVVDLSGGRDYRQNEDDVYVIKKKLGKFREIIIDVLEYFPTKEDIEDNYVDTFGGGTYKVFVGNTRLKLKKIAVYRITSVPSRNFSLGDAEKIEADAVKKWDAMRATTNKKDDNSLTSYSHSYSSVGNNMVLPRTPEEVAYMFLQSEKDRLLQELKHKEEMMNQMKENYEKEIKSLQKEKEQLQNKIHELEIEIIKSTKGGSVLDEINKLKTTAEVLGWNVGVQNQSAVLQVLNSEVGKQLISEVDKITDLLEKRWEISEWEKRLNAVKSKHAAQNPKPAKSKTVKKQPTGGAKTMNAAPSKDKLVKKLYELMKGRVPMDVCDFAVGVALKYTSDKSPKAILRNAVKVIITIQKAQDAATAIDNFVLSGRMTPAEAAAWIVEHEPAYAEQLANTSYDEILQQIKPFATNAHVKPLVEYYEQPEVKAAVEDVINELKKIYQQAKELEESHLDEDETPQDEDIFLAEGDEHEEKGAEGN